MRAIVLANQFAGRLREDPSLADPEALTNRFRRAGIDAEIRLTPPTEMQDAARRAADSPVDAVIVAGGDGTVRTVAEAMAGGDKPLGVLPLGTLNHFARDIGIPADLDAAIEMLAGGAVRRIDVGQVNDRIFVNNSSIGFYSQMVLDRDAQRPRGRRAKFVAMAKAFARVVIRFQRMKVQVRLDGEEDLPRTTPLVLISNNPYVSKWPEMARNRDLNCGRFGVYVARCNTRRQLLSCVFQSLFNQLDCVPTIESFTASAVTVRTTKSRLHVSLDGEVVRLQAPLIYRSWPAALPVLGGASPES